MILLAFTFTATGALAHNTMPRPESVTQPTNANLQAPKAKQMSDADLDNVTAGVFILNPGRHSVFIEHKNGTFTCVNTPSCAPPPPPPPAAPAP